MARPSPLSRPGPLMQSGLGPPLASVVITYAGHVGTDVEAALDGRPPTHVLASTDPTVTDDDTDGHVVGCRWVNEATPEEFVAVDVSTGAAVWESTTAGGGGSLDVTDGTTTVSPTTTIDFDPTYFDVTAPGGDVAEVTFIGSAGGITVEDEGTPLTTNATTLDFVGAGVTASGTGATKTITISGGGGGGALVLLHSVTLGSAASSIGQGSISGSYKDLVVVAHVRSTSAVTAMDTWVRVGNGSVDTGGNYGDNTTYAGDASGTVATNSGTQVYCGPLAGASSTSGVFSTIWLEIFDYASTTNYKAIMGRSINMACSVRFLAIINGAWKSTSAIDTIAVRPDSGNFDTGTRLFIYGRG
jgi:hypothetical protein